MSRCTLGQDGDILSSFLTEFTGGPWPLEDRRGVESRTTSTISNEEAGPLADNTRITDAALQPCDNASLEKRKTSLYSTVCKLSNTTYLRRMNLRKDDAVGLFPEIEKLVDSAFAKRQHDSPDFFKKSITVLIEDSDGRRWPVALECSRTAGQRHFELRSGWAEVCCANKLCVGTRLLLERREREQEVLRESYKTISQREALRYSGESIVALSISKKK